MALDEVQIDRRPSGALCTPAERVTRSLLGYGMVAGPFYIGASLIEALTRPQFDLARDDWSLLALGAVGWIHILVLALTGLMVIAAAIGFGRELRSQQQRAVAAWFLGAFGAGMVGAGFFVADPANGFPPGSPIGPTTTISWHGMLHLAFGGLGFIAATIACILIGRLFLRDGKRGWFTFSLVAGILFLASFIGVAAAPPQAASVLTFTAGVVLIFLWLFLTSRFLFYAIARRHALDK